MSDEVVAAPGAAGASAERLDVARLDVTGLGAAYGAGRLTPLDAVEAFLERIDRFNPVLNAFLALRREAALEEARASTERWRAGAPLSSLDGVPYGVKANIAVEDLPWHGGVAAYRDRVAEKDAACVSLLRKGGAIALGTLNMHEGALGAVTDNPHFGRCGNPWKEGATPGGSSGGSGAAVAAGLCAFALGTDTMGSVRIPSAYCGIAGHKPSKGAVPAEGLIDLSPTLDHIGPHAHTIADLMDILPVLTGRPAAPASAAPAPIDLRIGIAFWGGAVDVDSAVAEAHEEAKRIAKRIGPTARVDLSGIDFGAFRRKGLLVSEVEGFAAHQPMLARRPEGFSPAFRDLLEWGARQPPEKIDAAYAGIRLAGARLAALFAEGRVDVIMTPATPQGPFDFADAVPANQADFTAMANFAGAPATVLPASRRGAPPASVQFIAPKGRDDIALAAARAFEEARGEAPRPPGYF